MCGYYSSRAGIVTDTGIYALIPIQLTGNNDTFPNPRWIEDFSVRTLHRIGGSESVGCYIQGHCNNVTYLHFALNVYVSLHLSDEDLCCGRKRRNALLLHVAVPLESKVPGWTRGIFHLGITGLHWMSSRHKPIKFAK